ncbi:MAG: multiheme c-type cytochrome [Candidatus Promineifilaceae bacterium]
MAAETTPQNKVQLPTRQLTRFEEHRTWIKVAGGAAVGLLLLMCLIAFGAFESLDGFWFGRNLRGYTFFGLFFGILAVVLAFATFIYTARKRGAENSIPTKYRSTMMSWLWAHVYLGLLALLSAMIHAGPGLRGGQTTTTGDMLFWVFCLLVGSGVAWRLVYRYLPQRVQSEIGNYSEMISLGRAAEALVEIEKLAAGKSEAFQQMKDRLLEGDAVALDAFSAEERNDFAQVQTLAARRQRGLTRHVAQSKATRMLKIWRHLHIPLVAVFLLILLVHIVAVTDAGQRDASNLHPVEACADCHQGIVDQWRGSMHAHALTSPVTIVQTNIAVRTTLADHTLETQMICSNCHAPAAMLMTDQQQATLPVVPLYGETAAQVNEGVNCVICHQFNGETSTGAASFFDYQNGIRPGRVYYGGLDDSVGNDFHMGKSLERFDTPEATCESCHNVNVDLDGDGDLTKPGFDLVLQSSYREYEQEYLPNGGTETCVTCHMPLVDGGRVADSAEIPNEQDYAGPEREVRHHGFVGVDYPLDTVAISDPQKAARAALLQSAALLELDADSVTVSEDEIVFDVRVANNELGHQLPTGFAFARQMWLEVVVSDQDGVTLFESGLLATNVADLCDTDTMTDVLAEFVQDCSASDPQLVNFQQKLMSEVEPVFDEDGDAVIDAYGNTFAQASAGAQEVVVQSLDVGAIARIRPFDGQALTRLSPFDDTRSYAYAVPFSADVDEVTIEVRLLFRNLPPYFLRALADMQTPADGPDLFPMIDNLQIVEMNTDSITQTLP